MKQEYPNSKEITNRQMKITKHLTYLKTIAHDHGVAVVVTNHMITDITTNQLKPSGGNPFGHIPENKIF